MIRLVYDTELGECDLAQAADGGIDVGDELLTAVLISLFTDRLVEPSEVPEGVERAGWWGDAFPLDEGDRDAIGSRMWLLEGGRASPDAPVRARTYALEALRWMVDDSVASAVDASATRGAGGRIDLSVAITLTGGTVRTYPIPGFSGP